MRRIALVLLLLALASTAQAAAPARTLTVPGKLTALALDGTRVAYGVEPNGVGCRAVWVWDVARGTRTKASGKATCAIPRTSTGRGLAEVAVSGPNVAWIVQTGGNSEQSETLFVHTKTAAEQRVAQSYRTGDVSGALSGTWLGHLVSGANGIFFNAWTTSVAAGRQDVGAAVADRIVGTRPVPTIRGPHTLALRSASPGRLAALGDDGSVHVFRGTSEVPSASGTQTVRALALDGARLVTLYRPATLEVRSADDLRGAPIASFSAPPGAVTALAAARGIAVFAIGRVLYAESETTGKTAVLARSTRAWQFVALDSSLLVYAGSQTIRTLPFAAVAAALK
jgi:hypothetical protein